MCQKNSSLKIVGSKLFGAKNGWGQGSHRTSAWFVALKFVWWNVEVILLLKIQHNLMINNNKILAWKKYYHIRCVLMTILDISYAELVNLVVFLHNKERRETWSRWGGGEKLN